ncbi:hypothetical protein WJX84_006686 [Apatococcus fuscideae]|uniref:Transcription factor CBF/NF-Y/archaeal histone domain-containing protein n=1 Tax=Apatococcus fuscideae TaxID=2026836 RepID=A0AAW1SXY8_9CHLO
MEDSDILLPKLTVQKLVKDAVGADKRVAGDVVDNVLICCTEFIKLIVSQATEIGDAEGKTTVIPEHVIQALEKLGLGNYTAEVNACWEQFKADSKSAPQRLGGRKSNADAQGMSEEQQAALQEEMFNAARAQAADL